MPCRITLMRHGHAADDRNDDYSRPLSERGSAAARQAGLDLAQAGYAPEHVLASSALRALETAKLVALACGYTGTIEAQRSLYLADEAQYLVALQRLPDNVRNVLLVAHNPGLTALARQLCRTSGDLAPAEYVSVSVELEHWAELAYPRA
jgi:phosphohistidine phosphatase